MPTRDRHWRAQVIGGGATIAIVGIFVVGVVIAAVSAQLLRAYLFAPRLRSLTLLNIAAACVIVSYFTAQGVGLWRAGLRARARYKMRVAAMHGQPDAMPLVRRDSARGAPADAPAEPDMTLVQKRSGVALTHGEM